MAIQISKSLSVNLSSHDSFLNTRTVVRSRRHTDAFQYRFEIRIQEHNVHNLYRFGLCCGISSGYEAHRLYRITGRFLIRCIDRIRKQKLCLTTSIVAFNG